jgi:hypothetical protein
LFGYRGSSTPVTNSYYYRKTANVPAVAIGSGTTVGTELTNAQANTQSSYAGWDFTSIWQKDAGFMPHLRGITKPANINI